MKYEQILGDCIKELEPIMKECEGDTDLTDEIYCVIREKMSKLSYADIIWIMSFKGFWDEQISWYTIKDHLNPISIIGYCEYIISDYLETDIKNKLIKGE